MLPEYRFITEFTEAEKSSSIKFLTVTYSLADSAQFMNPYELLEYLNNEVTEDLLTQVNNYIEVLSRKNNSMSSPDISSMLLSAEKSLPPKHR